MCVRVHSAGTSLNKKLIGFTPWGADELGPEHTLTPYTAKQLGLWNDFPDLDTVPARNPPAGSSRGATVAGLLVVAAIACAWLGGGGAWMADVTADGTEL
jgi:hypothetical protein